MAGTPSVAEVDSMLQNVVDVLESIRNFGDGTLLGKLDTLEQSVEGDYAPGGLISAAIAFRQTIAAGCSAGMARGALIPVMREYGRLAGSRHWSGAKIGQLLEDVKRYWIDNSKTIEKRAITFDTTPTAGGSNTGDGSAKRLTVDAHGYDLDADTPETKKAECVTDQNTGARRHNEWFLLKGSDAGLDALDVQGSGGSVLIPARHAGTQGASGSLLKNASFQTYSASASPKFSGWDLSSGTSPSQDTTTHYRGFPGNTDTHSAKFEADAVISQTLSTRNTRLNRYRPYYFGIAYNRETGSGTMDLRIRLGSQSATVSLAAQTGWNLLEITLDENSWYQNFAEDELDLTIEVYNYSSGYLLVDDAIFCPLTRYDGTWFLIRGGPTPFMAANASQPYGDYFEYEDTGGAASDAKIAYQIHRAFRNDWPGVAILPSAASGSETVSDP